MKRLFTILTILNCHDSFAQGGAVIDSILNVHTKQIAALQSSTDTSNTDSILTVHTAQIAELQNDQLIPSTGLIIDGKLLKVNPKTTDDLLALIKAQQLEIDALKQRVLAIENWIKKPL